MRSDHGTSLRRAICMGGVLAGAVLAGCVTPYGPKGVLRGGYRETQVDDSTYRVAFTGNAGTSRSRVELALHYRCAQLALEKGFDAFVLLDEQTNVDSWTGSGQAPASYEAAASIRLVRGPRGTEASVFDAREVLRVVGPQIGEPPAAARPER